MKIGTVALIGRPNTGKSTLVNSLIGQKVAITSPKPQTTHFPIYAVYEDSRGQIVFVDTPGVFAKTVDGRAKEINLAAEGVLADGVDAVLYLIDHTRALGVEEQKVLSLVQKLQIPKILGVNKMDVKSPDYSQQYESMRDGFDTVVEISALKEWHLEGLLKVLFAKLPEGEKVVERESMPLPVLNMDSRMYIEEIIREKAFHALWDELPYSIRVVVETLEERDENTTFIKAVLFTTSVRYKKMIIGKDASIIRSIGMAVRKELSAMTGRRVILDLTVEVR
jgi:GTP-binding protein Era